MPKIRLGNKYKVNSPSGLLKSGVISKTPILIEKDLRAKKSYFEEETLHTFTSQEEKFKLFDDQRTIIFDTKEISTFLGIEEKYSNNTLIYHTPNNIDTSIKSQKKVLPFVYSRLLDSNLLESKKIQFKEDKDVDLKNKEESIEIDLNFQNDCVLSFSFINRLGDITATSLLDKYDTFKEAVSFTTTKEPITLESKNLFTTYFNFSRNDWDFLAGNYNPYENKFSQNYRSVTNGHIGGQNFYFENFTVSTNHTFQYSPICFSGINTRNHNTDLVSSKNLKIPKSSPIDTFGFPFEKKFTASNNQLLSMKNFIKKPFVLERIKIEGVFSNRSESPDTTSGETRNKSSLNFVNFFILNQRKKIHVSDLEEIDLEGSRKNNNKFIFNNSPVNFIDFPVFEDLANKYQENTTNNIVLNNDPNSQRDLIGYITLCNVSSGSYEVSNTYADGYDYNNLESCADHVEKIGHVLNVNNLASNANYTRRKISIVKNVKNASIKSNFSRMSRQNFYVNLKNSTRSGYDTFSGRSLNCEINNSKFEKNHLDSFSQEINVYSTDEIDNSYILYPEDNLIIGASLTPTFDIDVNSIHGKDFFIIHDNLKITLYGKYKENQEDIKIEKDHNFTNKIIKKIGIENQTVDNEIYYETSNLMSGSYFDRISLHKNVNNVSHDRVTNDLGLRSIPNTFLATNQDVNRYNYSLRKSTNPNFKNKVFSYTTETSMPFKGLEGDFIGDPEQRSYIKKLFNCKSYGQFKDLYNGSTYQPYEIRFPEYYFPQDKVVEENTDNIVHNIKKSFYYKNSFYEVQSESAVAYIDIDFSSMNNFNVNDGNWLLENFLYQPDTTYSNTLEFSIKDDANNQINYLLAPLGNSTPSISGMAYIPVNNKIYHILTINSSSNPPYNIVKAFTYNTGSGFSSDLNQQKIYLVETIVEGINNSCKKTTAQYLVGGGENKFDLNVTAEKVSYELEPEVFRIKLTLSEKNRLNKASISNLSTNYIRVQDFSFTNSLSGSFGINTFNVDDRSKILKFYNEVNNKV